MINVMDKSTHEENLSQLLQTNNKQFKNAVTFLSGYNGIFDVTRENNKFYFTRSINDDNFTKTIIPISAYETERLNNESKGNIIEQGYFTEANYPLKVRPNF